MSKTIASASIATRRVKLTAPGARAAGPYRAGVAYEVPADEAARLVKVKGFEYVEPEATPAAPADDEV